MVRFIQLRALIFNHQLELSKFVLLMTIFVTNSVGYI
jgi:hypothetical protein